MKPKTKRKNRMKLKNHKILGTSSLARKFVAANIAGKICKIFGFGKEIVDRAVEQERIQIIESAIKRYS